MEVEVLGRFMVTEGGQSLDIGSSKQRLLLAVLLAARGGPVRTEALTDALWGERPPASAGANLRQHVYRLRAVLGADRIERVGRDGLRLRLDGVSVEAHRFVDLAAAAEVELAAGRAPAARARLADALGLWHGTPFADLSFEPALAVEVAALVERHLAVVRRRIEIDLGLGRAAEVVAQLTELVAAYPYHEAFSAQLMLALYRCGRAADALAVYARARQVLADDLGLEPGPELRALEASILRQDDALHPPKPASAPAPAELPAPAADFTGRTAELALLDRFAGEPVTAVVGPAGVGKSALAMHWGHAAAGRFPDGQLFVDLHGFSATRATAPIEALAHLLRGLGLPPDQVPTDVDEAAARYRSLLAGRRVLVVLDNARSAAQIRMLLPGRGESLTLITSRRRLSGLVAHHPVRRVELAALPTDPAVHLLRQMLGARRVDAEPDAAAALAQACGNLPLALRIAAANLADQPGRTIADYLTELGPGQKLAALTSADGETTLRPMFDRSYAALDEATRQMFRRLGAVPGPFFTTETAAAVAGVPIATAAASLTRLADAHLVLTASPGRYSFHDLIGEYAALRHGPVRPGDLDGLYEHYIDRCRAAADTAYAHLARLPGPAATTTFADGTAARAWLAAELPNLVAVVRSAGTHPAAWRIADSLRGYFWQHRNHIDWRTVASAALAAAESAAAESAAVASALASLGQLHYSIRDYTAAIGHWTRGQALARQGGWALGEATIHSGLGAAYAGQGRLDQGRNHFIAALALHRAAGFHPGEMMTLSNLAEIETNLGEPAQAAGRFEQALALPGTELVPRTLSLVLANLAHTEIQLGRTASAGRHAKTALTLARANGWGDAQILALTALGTLARRDTPGPAQALSAEALTLAESLADPGLQAFCHNGLGFTYAQAGDPERAINHHRRAAQLADHSGVVGTNALIGLAAATLDRGDAEHARAFASRALSMARDRNLAILRRQAEELLLRCTDTLDRCPARPE